MGYNKRVPKGEPHMKYQVTHNVTRNGKVIVSKGDVITETQVTSKKVKNYVVPYVRVRVKYTTDEYNEMIKVYMNNDTLTLTELVGKLLETNPNIKHSNQGLEMYFSIIKGCDTTNEHVGLDNPSKELITLLRKVDSERF